MHRMHDCPSARPDPIHPCVSMHARRTKLAPALAPARANLARANETCTRKDDGALHDVEAGGARVGGSRAVVHGPAVCLHWSSFSFAAFLSLTHTHPPTNTLWNDSARSLAGSNNSRRLGTVQLGLGPNMGGGLDDIKGMVTAEVECTAVTKAADYVIFEALKKDNDNDGGS
mmetsp:Transcript_26473/g.70828  ORF Transcript_26473/g.70828 Transcript_26473/m.70828 type:complete len:172 (-) Transcript_26473:175-690(-)